jgi:hypothetical protein
VALEQPREKFIFAKPRPNPLSHLLAVTGELKLCATQNRSFSATLATQSRASYVRLGG